MGKYMSKTETLSIIKYAKAARMNPSLNGIIEDLLRRGVYKTVEEFKILYDTYMEKRAWNLGMYGDFENRYKCTIALLRKIEKDVDKRNWKGKNKILGKVHDDRSKLELILSSYSLLTIV